MSFIDLLNKKIDPREVVSLVGAIVFVLFAGVAITSSSPVISSAQSSATVVNATSGNGLTQAQIDAIVSLIRSFNADESVVSSVKAVLSGSTPTVSQPQFCYNWTRNLRIGDDGDDVSELITALNKEGLLSGKTDTFDEEVASAVVGLQEKYKSEVLTPNSLARGTGYVGASTRAKLNKLYRCVIPQSPVTVHSKIGQMTADGTEVGYTFTPASVAKWEVYIDCSSPVTASAKGGGDCGETTTLLYSVSGPHPSFPIWFKNPSNTNQTVGVKVKGYDSAGNLVGADSDAVNIPPTSGISHSFITVTYPQASNILDNSGGKDSGIIANIQWKNSNPNKDLTIGINLVSSSGYSRTVATGITNATSNSYRWAYDSTLPNGTYKVQVYEEGKDGSPKGESGYFQILNSPAQPSITVLSPNGGESWQKETTQTIKWQDNTPIPSCPEGAYCAPPAPKFYDITLAKYCPSGTACIAIAPYTVAKGVYGSSYSWSVGEIGFESLAPDGAYTVRVCVSGSDRCDTSDSYFKIISNSSRPSAVITSGSETSSLTPTISGKASGTNQIGISLSNSGGKVYGSGLTSVIDGLWSVTVSPALAPGQHKVTVYDGSNNLLTTGSLNVVSSQPSVTVLSPNGGESWQSGTRQLIRWTTQNVPVGDAGFLSISNVVTGDEVFNRNININIGQTYNYGGSLALVAPTANGQYRVTICSNTIQSPTASFKPLCDSSDSYFTITTATSTATTTTSFAGSSLAAVGVSGDSLVQVLQQLIQLLTK